MGCTFTKIRSLVELSFLERLNSGCTTQLSYIYVAFTVLAHIATLPCHVKIEFSSPSLHNARN
jgi:hypothetical protein